MFAMSAWTMRQLLPSCKIPRRSQSLQGAMPQLCVHTQMQALFAEVKGFKSAMIARLEIRAESEATEKAFCDKGLSETSKKKANQTAEIDKLSTKMDQMTTRPAQLKGEVATCKVSLPKHCHIVRCRDNCHSDIGLCTACGIQVPRQVQDFAELNVPRQKNL